MVSKTEALRLITNAPARKEHQEEFDRQVAAKTDDRGVCLLIVAQLENELERALDHDLCTPEDASIRAELYGQDGPLATFARKISMAAPLGIIGPITRNNLRIIRHVRNAFAHAKQPIKFDTPEVKAACEELQRFNVFSPPIPLLDKPNITSRELFEEVVGATLLRLAATTDVDLKWTPGPGEPDVIETGPLP